MELQILDRFTFTCRAESCIPRSGSRSKGKVATRNFISPTFLLFVVFAVTSCRKDVTLDLPDYQPKVVIEGSIETGSPALVFLSVGIPYFGEFDYTSPQKAFVKGATVIISDGSESETLTEVDTALGYVYVGTRLLGKEGRTYSITVFTEGKMFGTTSTILEPAPLDSIYFHRDPTYDSLGLMYQTFSEPAGSGDCYRWFSKRLHKDPLFAAPFNSVFDDKFIDGKTFEFAYDRGPQPNDLQGYRDDPLRGWYKLGDTVVVKFCKIGRREYDFWFTYYQNKTSNSNPFSAPTNVKSMFENYRDCFGAFVAYSPAFDTLIIR